MSEVWIRQTSQMLRYKEINAFLIDIDVDYIPTTEATRKILNRFPSAQFKFEKVHGGEMVKVVIDGMTWGWEVI